MQFESLVAFFDMGGYGFYVWLSFAVTLIALAGLIVDTRRQKQKLLQRALQAHSRRERIRAARQEQDV